MKVVRIVLCILLLSALLIAPPFLSDMARKDFFAEKRKLPIPEFSGTVTLYHIVSDRTYAGSLTSWLESNAKLYEKKHKGTHIIIEGMTEPYYLERIQYGRVPDAYSFFSGILEEDLLQPFETEQISLKTGLNDLENAVPYCYSGYCAIESNSNDAPLPEGDPIATVLMNSNAQGVITDFRSAGDCLRRETYGSSYSVSSCGNFTDQVCWLGIDRRTDEEKAHVLADFFAFLRAPLQQQTLSHLGAFSVLQSVTDTAPLREWKEIYTGYQTVTTVDPFQLARNRGALTADAEKAQGGDTEAWIRFQSRIEQILCK
ncbi:MAG: hypothetical protein IJK01_00670 [Clostridia bacterium]|nr:hypothetical protein [Clostridia bacterium]